MTEQDWLSSTDAETMIRFLGEKVSDRKLRLFAVACCRHNIMTMADGRRRKAVEVAELFADGLASDQERLAVHLSVDPIWGKSEAFAFCASALPLLIEDYFLHQKPRRLNQAQLVRDIFGNPFQCIPSVATWLTPAVIDLARKIYEDRAIAQMPELGDALKNAGCDNMEILSHCDESPPHFRGCWVVDLLLGKQ